MAVSPRRFAGLASLLCVGAILWLTLAPHPLPSDMDVPLFPGVDKVVHALMFGGLAVCLLFDRMLLSRKPLTAGWAWGAAAVSALFGGAIEIAQWGMALGRGAELLDFLADILGAVVGAFLFRACALRFQK